CEGCLGMAALWPSLRRQLPRRRGTDDDSPVFHGAEPNEIDAGPRAGLRSVADRVDAGTDLMACMSENQRAEAVIYDEIVDPAMPEGRIHPGDERHLAGAFQDNRVIPYEGVQVATLDARAQEAVV